MTSQKKSQKAADVVAALLKEAEDPGQTPKRLREIWDSTKSSRVRKAVASNTNLDSKTMAMAARLYIRQVIENPSFTLLNVFAEDKIVKAMYEAYSEPKDIRVLSIRDPEERANVAKALLVSPYLNSVGQLQAVCSVLSKAEFSREIKDPLVKGRITIVAKKFTKTRGMLSTILFLYSQDILTIKEVGESLKLIEDHRHKVGKNAYLRFIKHLLNGYIANPDYLEYLYDFIRVNMKISIRDVIKGNEEFLSDHCLKAFAGVYRRFLDKDVDSLKKIHACSFGNCSLDEDFVSYHLSKLVWALIINRNRIKNRKLETLKEIDMGLLFKDIKSIGFHLDYGPYECQLKFYNEEIKYKNLFCRKLLELKDDQAFLFYVSCNVLWSHWYIKGDTSTPERQVVDRINTLNKDLFDKGMKLLYSCSNIDYHAYFSMHYSHGIKHNPRDYTYNFI